MSNHTNTIFQVGTITYRIENGRVIDSDGKTAVLVSHSSEYGWSTFEEKSKELLLYYPKMVKYILEGNMQNTIIGSHAALHVKNNFNIFTEIDSNMRDFLFPIGLTVYWVSPKERFRVISSYSGERLEVLKLDDWEST